MTSRRVAELEDECLVIDHDVDTDPYALQVRPMFFEFLRDAGHPVEDVKTVYNGVSLKEDGNKGYLVMEIETLDYPVDIADAVEDKVSVWCCSCPGFTYHRSPDLRENERPSEAGECSHITRVKRKERDPVEGQTDLGEVIE